ncbi:MAG TPA: thioredoxin family protein, partial [Polyangiaceae bacterium]|nr:thioredoxin family protein [Polyangiaceae bacterium]
LRCETPPRPSTMSTEPTRPEIDSTPGLLVLEFGARWCPICQAARGLIDAALAGSTDVTHLWVEDGKGKPLGRSFKVKLWPTLVFLRDGKEVARVVRPREPGELDAALRVLR